MNIVHTVASVEQEASGPSYSVPSLAAALGRVGHDAEVVALGDGEQRTVCGARVVTFLRDGMRPKALMRLGRSRAMRDYLLKSEADVFHAHGLWMMPNVYPAEAARRFGKPFMLAPRGMLGRDALKFSATTKRLFWAVWQRSAADAVSCFHATAESEYDDIRAFGLKQPVANARYLATGDTAALYVKGDDIHINARGQRALVGGLEHCRAEARIPMLLSSGHDEISVE